MPPTNASPTLEIVVLAAGPDDLERSVRRLHRHLARTFPDGWRITIAAQGTTNGAGPEAARLAEQLDHVQAVSLPGRLDRKALRLQWSSSPTDVVAFVELAPDADLEALLAPLLPRSVRSTPAPPTGLPPGDSDPAAEAWETSLLPRRAALFSIGGLGLTALLAACGSGSSNGAGSTATPAGSGVSDTTGTTSDASAGTTGATTGSTTAATAGTATSVVLAPEMTEGPYFLDLNLVRSDIREDREGAPLALNLVVADASTGAPIEGATVDIWHCDANGLYSGFVSESAQANNSGDTTDSGTFLRGTQLSGVDGAVTFATVYPGWYQGRTVHIHLKVRVDGTDIHTGQLFFDDAFTDSVYAATEPYASRSERELRNDDDGIYSGGGAESTLDVGQTGDGYAATMAVGVSTS